MPNPKKTRDKFEETAVRKGISENLLKVELRLQGQIAKLKRFIQRRTNHWVHLSKLVTTAGGNAVETIVVTGLKANRPVLVDITQPGAVPRTIVSYKTIQDGVEITFSGDPANDHVISCIVCYCQFEK